MDDQRDLQRELAGFLDDAAPVESNGDSPLSRRETEVLRLVAAGSRQRDCRVAHSQRAHRAPALANVLRELTQSSRAAPAAATATRAGYICLPGRLQPVTHDRDPLHAETLRVHDHPALRAAWTAATSCRSSSSTTGFSTAGAPNRVAFLLETLADLQHSLADRGSGLVVRRGDPLREAVRLAGETGAERIHLSEDVSTFAQERQRRLGRAAEERRIEVEAFPGVTVVPPGDARRRLWRSLPGVHAVLERDGASRRGAPCSARLRRSPRTARRTTRRFPGSASSRTGTWPRTSRRAVRPREGRGSPAGCATASASTTSRHDDLAVEGTSGSPRISTSGACHPSRWRSVRWRRPAARPSYGNSAWRDFHHQAARGRPAMRPRDLHPRRRSLA